MFTSIERKLHVSTPYEFLVINSIELSKSSKIISIFWTKELTPVTTSITQGWPLS